MPAVDASSSLASLLEPSKRDSAPRIGGSQAGFIALVVGLTVIILASCVAIYILLRDHDPSPRERQARRTRRAPSDAAAAATHKAPWATLGGMFGAKGRDGHWIQASGDAWEADEADRREMAAVDAPFRPPPAHTPSASQSFGSYTSTSTSASPGPDPVRALPRTTSPTAHFGSPSASVLFDTPGGTHAIAPQLAALREQSQVRHLSLDSLASVRTFEGGTKFVEGL